jgi:hypothetical protein
MSIETSEARYQCPKCRLKMRRFLTSHPSLTRSPWCRRCTMRALIEARPLPPHATDPGLAPMVPQCRAAGWDTTADRGLRVFALAVLEDKGLADDDDVTLLRLLEFGATDRQIAADMGAAAPRPPKPPIPTEATRAALGGSEPSGPPPDTQADREGGRKAGESTSDEDDL